jgi:pyruvate, water dikinase
MMIDRLGSAAAAPATIGGKAWTLGRLLRAGLPVPGGFVVTADGIEQRGSPAFLAAFGDAWESLGAPAVAVRSSAIGEDGPGASFAGIHRTSLNVRSAAAAAAALAAVFDSARAAAAHRYRERLGIASAPRIAALVQTFVDSTVAGVAFTRHPQTGASEVVVEAAWGLGEAVVAGVVNPDRYVLSPSGRVLAASVGEKDLAIVADRTGTRQVEVAPERRTQPCLAADDLAAVCALAMRCEQLLAAPQDVEWALAGARLFLLQSRPITGAGGRPAVAAPARQELAETRRP